MTAGRRRPCRAAIQDAGASVGPIARAIALASPSAGASVVIMPRTYALERVAATRHSISYVTCNVAVTVASPGSIGVGVARASAAMAPSKRRGTTIAGGDVVAESTPFSRRSEEHTSEL